MSRILSGQVHPLSLGQLTPRLPERDGSPGRPTPSRTRPDTRSLPRESAPSSVSDPNPMGQTENKKFGVGLRPAREWTSYRRVSLWTQLRLGTQSGTFSTFVVKHKPHTPIFVGSSGLPQPLNQLALVRPLTEEEGPLGSRVMFPLEEKRGTGSDGVICPVPLRLPTSLTPERH